MRSRKTDSVTGAKQEGDQAIGELIQKLIMLYPMAIGQHGRFDPLLMQFLFGTMPVNKMTFECNRADVADRPNATKMYHRLTTAPCPNGIFITARINWKTNKTDPFSGGSHTAPTPVAYTMQQIGLAITKGYVLLF